MTPRRNNAPTNQQRELNRSIVLRFGFVLAACLILVGFIIWHLVDNTIVHAPQWNRMGDSTLASVKHVEPVRGEIFAADGSILATNIYYYNVMMDLRTESFKIIEFDAALDSLCDSLAAHYPPYDAARWRAKFQAQLDKTVGKRTRNFVLARQVPKKEYTRILKTFPFFKNFSSSNKHGLKCEPVLKRVYPYGEMASLSVGRVYMDSCNQIHGYAGLEEALDSVLYGRAGVSVRGLSTRGLKYYVDTPAVKGCDVYTTIDITLQDILENELSDMILQSGAEWGTAMIMETATGDIKAISNLEPDPDSRTPRCYEALNRIVLGYEPGSVMKVMTMAVALEKGFARPLEREYPIGRHYAFPHAPITDTHSPATLPVSRFLEYSSNIGMTKLTVPHYASNPRQFREDLAELGFFDRFNTGISRERRPRFVADPSLVDLSRMCFGYSTSIPPLYTCAFYNAVANGGRFVRPRLIRGLRMPDGSDSVVPVQYVRERMMSEDNAAALRKMMHEVVWGPGGTAPKLKDKQVELAGKTGSSRIAMERPRPEPGDTVSAKKPWKGGYRTGVLRFSFCGFFPYDNPKYTAIVVLSAPKGEYRTPQTSSGRVVLNVAKKMYARGMLTDNPDFVESPSEGNRAVLYSSFDDSRNPSLRRDLTLSNPKAFRSPGAADSVGCVPDVTGVSLQEALTHLESHGYAVEFEGVGYVAAQTPAAGTPAVPGTKIHLTLRHD